MSGNELVDETLLRSATEGADDEPREHRDMAVDTAAHRHRRRVDEASQRTGVRTREARSVGAAYIRPRRRAPLAPHRRAERRAAARTLGELGLYLQTRD